MGWKTCAGGIILCIVMELWKCNTIYGMFWVEYLQCNLITMWGVLSVFFLIKNFRLGNMAKKIIGMFGPTVILVYILHEVFLPYFVHKSTAVPILWLLMFWITCFVVSYLLNKVRLISNFFKI